MIINKVGIVGLGAIGGMYADLFRKKMSADSIICIAEEDRIKRYKKDGVFVNGERLDISYMTPAEAGIVDLLIFATKYYALKEAAESAAECCGEDTIVMSFLNGVTSESIVEGILHPKHLLYTTVQGMNAAKEGNHITYSHAGAVSFGERDGSKSEAYKAVQDYFERTEVIYRNPDDMMKQLYNKWMCNVGINQTCAYYAVPYGACHTGQPYRDTFIAAMREAKACANAEGINLTDEDVEHWAHVMDKMNAESEPSMRQDTKAGRKTEADLFCGTVCELAEKHGIDVPVNKMFKERFL